MLFIIMLVGSIQCTHYALRAKRCVKYAVKCVRFADDIKIVLSQKAHKQPFTVLSKTFQSDDNLNHTRRKADSYYCILYPALHAKRSMRTLSTVNVHCQLSIARLSVMARISSLSGFFM